MDVDSTEIRLEELSGFLKEDGSSFTAESDLSFVINKEENVEDYSYADIARNKEFIVDLSDQGQHSDFRFNEISGSPSENFQSDLQTGFDHDHDLLLNGAGVSVDHHPKEETEEEFAVDLLKSSAHVESQNFHHEMESEVAANREFPLTNQEEEMQELVKSEFAYEKLEHEIYDLQSEKLQGDNEAKREDIDLKNSPAESIKLEILHPRQHNLEQTPLESTSLRTERKMSVSPLTSPSNKEMFASQEKSSIGKEVLSEDHKLGGDRQNAASPQESPRGSQRMNGCFVEHVGASPRNHDSSEKHRRRYSSASRSPIRQRDSCSRRHKRDHHHRSRSRSPYRRDYYRRSPRRRYSPRCRSPPSGYHAYRRSPKRRQWSPPHNRSTGLGKPGRNLFVAGFSFLTTERDLERKFSRFGRVRDVRIVRDKRSGDSRGFGFLSLERDEEADAAIRALDKTEWHGRIVLVEKSKSH